jgi:hypothetical protein
VQPGQAVAVRNGLQRGGEFFGCGGAELDAHVFQDIFAPCLDAGLFLKFLDDFRLFICSLPMNSATLISG